MAPTLKERLDKIARGEQEVIKLFSGFVEAGQAMQVSDFLLLGVLKRTLAHADGFRGHIEKPQFYLRGHASSGAARHRTPRKRPFPGE